jgi:hypothetical protein
MEMVNNDHSIMTQPILIIIIIICRPLSKDTPIRPSELRNHCLLHCMLGPCCLCPLAYQSGPDFVEAAIYSMGTLSEEYVASCTRRTLQDTQTPLQLVVT